MDAPTCPPPAPVVTVPGAVVREALALAGGDRRRLRVNDDGTVTVTNTPRRP
ncbi:hypothetical protein [Geodermatophilus sp. TF02-6]|uniref:hypothetical protein n=1 Tax=Geodermatophilus sp. TF02-6 TaxID=2250575 RepID=UPI001314721E|nr:hypothetical protein [Geodermatophilus sp. TF02-6]